MATLNTQPLHLIKAPVQMVNFYENILSALVDDVVSHIKIQSPENHLLQHDIFMDNVKHQVFDMLLSAENVPTYNLTDSVNIAVRLAIILHLRKLAAELPENDQMAFELLNSGSMILANLKRYSLAKSVLDKDWFYDMIKYTLGELPHPDDVTVLTIINGCNSIDHYSMNTYNGWINLLCSTLIPLIQAGQMDLYMGYNMRPTPNFGYEPLNQRMAQSLYNATQQMYPHDMYANRRHHVQNGRHLSPQYPYGVNGERMDKYVNPNSQSMYPQDTMDNSNGSVQNQWQSNEDVERPFGYPIDTSIAEVGSHNNLPKSDITGRVPPFNTTK